MGKVFANFDEVSAGSVVPVGKYATRIDKIEEKVSPNKNEYWFVHFTLTEEPFIGRKVFTNIMLDVASLWKLRQLTDAIGIDMTGRQDFDSTELIGQEVGVRVEPETFEGQERSRVKGFFSLIG